MGLRPHLASLSLRYHFLTAQVEIFFWMSIFQFELPADVGVGSAAVGKILVGGSRVGAGGMVLLGSVDAFG